MMSSRPGSARTLWAAPDARGLWTRPSLLKTTLAALAVAVVITFLFAGLAFAGDPTGARHRRRRRRDRQGRRQPHDRARSPPTSGTSKTSLNLFFVIFGGALVFFMQAGFAMVETGFCRSKNAVHVIMTNFVIFAIGMIAYWAVGFALMFGGVGTLATLGGTQPLDGLTEIADGWGVFGHQGFFLSGGTYDVVILGFFFFQIVFMDTAATIPTGAMAERWKFSAFVVYGFFIAAIVYPIYGNWVWGGGWLSALGRNVGLGHGAVDFAGSGVVHAVGGFAALAGAIVLGPRVGKFAKDGTPAGHPGAQHPARHPRHDHPGLRLDRLQRRLDPGGHRPALQRRHREHVHRLGVRLPGGDVPGVEEVRQARPLDGRQRHARRPRGHHRAVRLRRHRRRLRHRPGRRLRRGRRHRVRRGQAQGRRSRRRRLGARRLRRSGASSPSACSPTAPTATAGTASPAP